MYSILRVPNNKDQYKEAYNILIAFNHSYKLSFEDMYAKAKSSYVFFDKCGYEAVAFIRHENYEDINYIPIKFRPYQDSVYVLDLSENFTDSHYFKSFKFIETIIRDNIDRAIIIESIPNNKKYIVNALKNLKFKQIKDEGRTYTSYWYYIPNQTHITIDERKFIDINPKDDLHTIDKMVHFNCFTDREAELRDQYTKDLIRKNIDNQEEASINDESVLQTEKEFIGISNSKNCCINSDSCDTNWDTNGTLKFIKDSNGICYEILCTDAGGSGN